MSQAPLDPCPAQGLSEWPVGKFAERFGGELGSSWHTVSSSGWKCTVTSQILCLSGECGQALLSEPSSVGGHLGLRMPPTEPPNIHSSSGASRTENGAEAAVPVQMPSSHPLLPICLATLLLQLCSPHCSACVTWPSPFLPGGEAVWPSAQEAASRRDSLGLSLSPHLPSGFLGPVIFNHPAFHSSSVCAGNGTPSRRGLLGRLSEMMFAKFSPQRLIRDMAGFPASSRSPSQPTFHTCSRVDLNRHDTCPIMPLVCLNHLAGRRVSPKVSSEKHHPRRRTV